MRRIKWVLSAIAVSVFVACMFAASDAALAQGAKAQATKAAEDRDPLFAAILLDHPAEVRAINRMLDKGDREAAINALSDVFLKYGLSALGRASDAYAVDLANKASAVTEVLADQYPAGCRDFIAFEQSSDARSIPEVAERFRDFREARYLAYVDGKSRAPVAELSSVALFRVANENLGLSLAELGLLLSPENVPDAQLCSMLKRFWNVSGVPEALRADWARSVTALRQ